MADGELTAREAERVVWDVIVVGTGMGGGMLGYRWPARAGGCCSSKRAARHCPGHRERFAPPCPNWPSRFRPVPQRPTTTPWPGPDAPPTRSKTSAGASRSGSCRSSAAAPADPRPCTAWSANDFSSRDFTPRQNFRDPGDSTVPEAWPISYDQMRPGTPRPKSCWGFAANPIPCARRPPRSACPPAPPFSTDNQPLVNYLAGRGLHPYHLPMACDYTDGCATCQTYLCPQSCKNDAARNGVLPAVAEHGAQLLAECRVRAPGGRPHPGPAGDLPASLRHAGPEGQGGGAGRRCAGHPGAVAQFPVRRVAARIGQRLRLGGPQLDAPSARPDRDLAATPTARSRPRTRRSGSTTSISGRGRNTAPCSHSARYRPWSG